MSVIESFTCEHQGCLSMAAWVWHGEALCHSHYHEAIKIHEQSTRR